MLIGHDRGDYQYKLDTTLHRTAPFARTVEDKDMNDELKAVTRWGDPMVNTYTPNHIPKILDPGP